MHELFRNPLWWVIPAILIASWVYNHRDFSSSNGEAKKPNKKSKAETPAEDTATSSQIGSDSGPEA